MITVNGEEMTLEKPVTIQTWLAGKGLNPELIAVEYNGLLLMREQYSVIVMNDGDSLEIVRFVGGG